MSYLYQAQGEIKGELIVYVDQRSDVIINIELRPEKLSREEAIRHFGSDYIVTRYNFDVCLEDGDSDPLYESPNGSLAKIEYRERGIAIPVNDAGEVLHIMYVSEPVGAPEARCNPGGRAAFDWRVATYKGLTMGKSTRADVLRVFGQPQRVDSPFDQPKDDPDPEEWYIYDAGGELPGTLTAVLAKKSGRLLAIDLEPQHLTKEEAIRHFGDDYLLTRYSHDSCLGNEESAPVYESLHGAIQLIEYRDRGIAISYNEKNKVRRITYLSEPVGAPSSGCKGRAQPFP